MGLKLSEIRRVLEAFDASDWDEIHISDGETELHLVAAGVTPNTVPSASEAVSAAASVAPAVVTAPATAAAPVTASSSHVSLAVGAIDPNAAPVLAPSMGVFYRAPSPGAPPFVEVGNVVEPDTTVCIVEVMKLMNPIQAGIAGTVVGIHVNNADRVVSGQTLFTIAPAG